MTNPLISIIVPMYNEADGAEIFFARITPILNSITENWEIIVIDDGSKDKTSAIIENYIYNEPRVKLIRFSRNFGKDIALSAGIDFSSGDAVIPIDADLQDPPELIAEIVAKWREGFKVVLATRKSRTNQESCLKRLTAKLFYKVIRMTSDIEIPANTADFGLMDRAVVEAIKLMPERTRFVRGLLAWVGFSSTTVYYHRPERHVGITKWSGFGLWKYALDGIVAFSTIPLKIWTYIGFSISCPSFIYGLYTLIFSNNASIIAAIFFIGGIQLIGIGVLGEYIARIYNETKQRPLYIIDQKVGL